MALLEPYYICLYENSTELLAKLSFICKIISNMERYPIQENKQIGYLSVLDFEKKRYVSSFIRTMNGICSFC